MKRLAVCLLTICLVILLTACGGGKSAEVDIEALAADLVGSDAFAGDMSAAQVSSGVAAGTYGYSAEDVESAVMYYDTGTAEEIFLAKTTSADAANSLYELCRTRVQNQIASLQNYIPEAVARLENAVVEKTGEYVILVVANDGAAAKSIVDKHVG